MEERAVPLEDGLADLVYMINLHHELEAPEEILNESYRLLKENGKIFTRFSIKLKLRNIQKSGPYPL